MADVLCPVVVGRDRELGVLRSALDAARRGEGSVVMLVGEAGIGKSRLARELVKEAEAAGMVVLRGRAVPGAAKAPFRPLAEALAPVVDEFARAGSTLDPWLPALAAVVPGLRAPHPGPGDASDAARGESVVRALSSLVDGHGGLLVLEDLHWADPDTLAVVEHLTDNLYRAAVLCLVTLRSEEPSSGRDLARVVADRRSAVVLELGRLTNAEVIAMVSECAEGVGAADIDRVVSVAEGVPFLVEELLASPGVPETFADSVQRRLEPLDHWTRSVLASAATLGRHFDWHLLESATNLDAAKVAEALELGVRSQLLTVEGDSFRFRHALTSEAVLNAVLPPRRVAIANAALQALDHARPAVLGAADRELAAGLAERAEQPERAGALFAEIGVDALAAGALASAAVALNRATQLLAPGGARTAAALALVTALADAGRVDEALTATKELLVDEVGESRAIAHLRVARAAMATTRWDLARAQLSFGRQHIGDEPRRELRAELAVLDGELAFGLGDITGALQSAIVALETVEVADAPDVACEALLLRGRAARASSLEAAQAAFADAAAIAEAHDLPVWQLRSLHELGTIDMLERADARLLEQARALADELGALATATVLDIELCANYLIAGDDERSIAHGRAAAQRAMDLGQVQAAIAALHLLGTTYVVSGDRVAANHAAAVARGLSPDDHMVETSFLLAVDAVAALLDEDRRRASTAFERGMATLRNGPVSAPASYKGLWPLVLAVEGRDDEASEALVHLVDSGATVNRLNLGYHDYARAILAGRRSPEEATNFVARGDGHLLHGPFWHQLGRRLVAEAATSDGWGDPERWWSEAGAYFEEHGHEPIAARVHRRWTDGNRLGARSIVAVREPRRHPARGRRAGTRSRRIGQQGDRRSSVPLTANRGEARRESSAQDERS